MPKRHPARLRQWARLCGVSAVTGGLARPRELSRPRGLPLGTLQYVSRLLHGTESAPLFLRSVPPHCWPQEQSLSKPGYQVGGGKPRSGVTLGGRSQAPRVLAPPAGSPPHILQVTVGGAGMLSGQRPLGILPTSQDLTDRNLLTT